MPPYVLGVPTGVGEDPSVYTACGPHPRIEFYSPDYTEICGGAYDITNSPLIDDMYLDSQSDALYLIGNDGEMRLLTESPAVTESEGLYDVLIKLKAGARP